MKRSSDILNGAEWANVRALYKSSGFTDDELKNPIIAVVNAYNQVCPGHVVLKQLTQRVKEGIYAAGGTPVEIGTIGACDGVAMSHKGMQYILPTREMIADDIEAMAEAHRLDGLVILGSCDKIVPGMILGALRVNLPTVFVNGGPTLPGRMKEGNPYGGEYIDHSIIQQSEGALKSGAITQEEFDWIENNAVPTIGSCAMLGTANTMCCLSEVMGISLPGSAAIPAVYSRRQSIAFESGKAVMNLVKNNICIKDIVTKDAILNAIKVNSAIGGSTNAVLHLLAIAYEAGVELDIFEFGKVSMSVPHMVPMIPAGQYTLLDFYEAGGIPVMMKELASILMLDGITCTGHTSKENIDEFRWQLNHNQKLTKEQLTPVTWIDVPMPLGYAGFPLIEQLKLLEPFGKGNEKPVFADKNLRVRQASIIGKNRNVLKMVLEDANAYSYDAIMFRADSMNVPKREQNISIVYYPSINEFNGKKTIQFVVTEWK